MEAHNELMFGAPDQPQPQRRKLNIEEDQVHEFHSDEEEALCQLDNEFTKMQRLPLHMQQDQKEESKF